jgi:hypothetical protein
MEELKTKIQIKTYDNIELKFISDTYVCELLDTSVFLNGIHICVIAGTDIQNFYDGFVGLINKYRI